MPDVYRSGETIPELGGPIEGATTVVIHRPEELGGLDAIAALAGTPPEDPMAAISRALQAESLDLEAWKRWSLRRLIPPLPTYDLRPRPADAPPPETSEERQEADEPAELLRIMLHEAHRVWVAHDEEDRGQLALLMTVANPDPVRPDGPIVEIKPQRPALFMHPGSRIAEIAKAPLKCSIFAVGLVLGGGVTTSQRAANLVERTRRRALSAANVTALANLNESRPASIADQCGLVVFVHGLFSIDVKTFEALCSRLATSGFALTGFPHNSLDKIEDNARTLAKAIAGLLDGRDIPVALVCHSRGGLVARRAAEYLYEDDRRHDTNRWKGLLRICVTFGTPHDGAELAEVPGQLLASLIMYGIHRRGASLYSLVDVLSVWDQHNGVPGVENLKPRRAGNDFLTTLEDLEGIAPQLPIVAVGGEAERGWLWNRLLGDAAHDHIVLQRSALPTFVGPDRQLKTRCDHFKYFDDPQQREVLDDVTARVISSLKMAPAITAADMSTPKSVAEIASKPIKYKTSTNPG